MLTKPCYRCKKRIPIGSECNCSSKLKYKPTASDNYSSELKAFYGTEDWKKARTLCIARCYGLDLYSLFVLGRIEYGFTVHHIVPLTDDYSLRLSPDNLIYLTDSNHRRIHELYRTEYKETTELLKTILKRAESLLRTA